MIANDNCIKKCNKFVVTDCVPKNNKKNQVNDNNFSPLI